MKLLKLSLATALTAGSLTTATFATPLEEAIKNVDLSGSVMLRYDYVTKKNDKKDGNSKWKVKGVLNFKTTFDDNFFAFAGLKIDDEDKGTSKASSEASGKVELYNAYLGYTTGNTTILAGRQNAGTFFTDDLYGDGIKIVNSDVEGLTLAALWLDNFNEDGDIGSNNGTKIADTDPNKSSHDLLADRAINSHDLLGVAAIGSYEPVSFQLWYARLAQVTDLMAAELGFNFEVDKGTTLGLLAQYGHSDFDGKFKKKLLDAVDDGDFYGIQASVNVSGFDLSGGYVNFSTESNKLSLNSFEDKGSFISAGEQINNDYSLYSGKNRMWFVTAEYEIPDSGFTIGAEYAKLRSKDMLSLKYDSAKSTVMPEKDGKKISKEVVARIGYNYSKKLKFSSYYSHLSEKAAKEKSSQNKVRFQVKYSF